MKTTYIGIPANRQGQDKPAGRTMVFAASDAEARAAARPLRNVLWGDHKMSVLLPTGAEPIKVKGFPRTVHCQLRRCSVEGSGSII